MYTSRHIIKAKTSIEYDEKIVYQKNYEIKNPSEAIAPDGFFISIYSQKMLPLLLQFPRVPLSYRQL